MDPYRYVCKRVVIPVWAWWEDSPYLRHLEHLMESQYFNPEQMREIQWARVRGIVNHAYGRTKYYRESFQRRGLHPGDLRTFDDFADVPILTKDEVREHLEELIADGSDRYFEFLTSGSTGKPLKGFRDKASQEFKRACGMRSNLWAGYDLGERIYCLYGDPEKELIGVRKMKAKIRRKCLQRTEILDMLRLSDESMLNFAYKMKKAPPSLLWGHAHGLYLLARFLESREICDIRPKGMYSAGMVLHRWERDKVQDVFQCQLQDRYGCEELGLIATECKAQEGLHINTDDLYVEFLDSANRPVAPGQCGQVVITDLSNMTMPFIRYKMEDIGVPSADPCSCGRTQPLIASIEGRIADFLVTPEGKLVSGISLTDHFAGHIPGVAQMQIVQEETDLLLLNVVKDKEFGHRSVEQISHLVGEFFGERMRFQFNFVEEIPKTNTGKYRFTVCKLRHELL